MKDKKERELRSWTIGISLVIIFFTGFLFVDYPEYKYILNAKYISYHQVSKSVKSFGYDYMATIKIENGDVIFRKVSYSDIKNDIRVAVYKRRITGFESYKVVFR